MGQLGIHILWKIGWVSFQKLNYTYSTILTFHRGVLMLPENMGKDIHNSIINNSQINIDDKIHFSIHQQNSTDTQHNTTQTKQKNMWVTLIAMALSKSTHTV